MLSGHISDSISFLIIAIQSAALCSKAPPWQYQNQVFYSFPASIRRLKTQLYN